MKTTTKTLLAAFMLLTISCKKETTTIQSSSIADQSSAQALSTGSNESEIYPSVKIGKAVVMKKNLNVSRYRNGNLIPEVKDVTWNDLTTGAWCWYNNDSANGSIYGKLYNWYAVNDPRGLAPEGWHIPSDEEATTLINSIGGESVAGGKMKSTGTIEAGTGLWYAPNTDATNSSGFTGLPGGNRGVGHTYVEFYDIGIKGYWWTSSGWLRGLNYGSGGVSRYYGGTQAGFSVRCLRD